MSVNEKIRKIREAKDWAQEQMAEKLNMSLNSYAKIERGEIKLYLNKLEQIAQILDIDIVELIQSGEKNICFQIESPLGSVYQGGENQRCLLRLNNWSCPFPIRMKKESLLNRLLEQKDNEIKTIKDLLRLTKLEDI